MKKRIALLLATLMLLAMLPTTLAAEYKDKATVKDVQQALNDAGYDCGKPDGAAGKKTRAAITAYQADKGLEVTGVIDDALLEALGVAADAAEAEADSPDEAAAVNGTGETAGTVAEDAAEASPLPQELVDLTGGMPDTFDELAERFDIDALKALAERFDGGAVLNELLERGTAPLPDLGIQWEVVVGFHPDGEIYLITDDSDYPDSILLTTGTDNGVATVSLNGEYQPGSKVASFQYTQYFEGGAVTSFCDCDRETGAIAHVDIQPEYILAEEVETEHYYVEYSTLNYYNGYFNLSIEARTKEGDREVYWTCGYEPIDGEYVLTDRHFVDYASGERIDF